MEQEMAGRVLTEATLVNLYDVWEAERGFISPENVRRITVTDARVDTKALMLSASARLIRQLGLTESGKQHVSGREVTSYGPVRLTIQDRECPLDVLEAPEDESIIVGWLPLHQLDLVVDPVAHKLTGNPAHGGEHIIEMY
jgi:hypothetical protein